MNHRIVTEKGVSRALVVAAAMFVGLLPEAAFAADPARALDRAANWLITQQNADGGYGPQRPGDKGEARKSDVGITAFVLYALARSPRQYKEADGPYISRAVEFL